MFNELVTNICLYTTLKGCPETLKAFGAETHLSNNFDSKAQEFLKVINREAFSLFGKKNVEYSLTAASITNSIITQSIELKTPFKPLNGEMNLSANPNGYNFNWKWDLE